MTSAQPQRHAPPTQLPVIDRRTRIRRVAHRASGAIATAGARASALKDGVSGTMTVTRDGARGSTRALQVLPDSTLRLLAAASVGVGAGLYLAGAPRVVSAVGASPALFMGAAIVTRSNQPDTDVEPAR